MAYEIVENTRLAANKVNEKKSKKFNVFVLPTMYYNDKKGVCKEVLINLEQDYSDLLMKNDKGETIVIPKHDDFLALTSRNDPLPHSIEPFKAYFEAIQYIQSKEMV